MDFLFVPEKNRFVSIGGKRVHGLLGYDFLRHFLTTFNFRKRIVRLKYQGEGNEPALLTDTH